MGLSDMFRSFVGLPPRDESNRGRIPPEFYGESRRPSNMDEWLRDVPTIYFGTPAPRGGPGTPIRDADDDNDEDDGHPIHGGHGRRDPFHFGFSFRFPFDHGHEGAEDGGDQDENDPFSFGVTVTEPDAMFRHFEDMFRSFDEVFKGMGMAEGFPKGFHGHGAPPALPGGPGDDRQGALRDKMLKEPDSHTAPRQGMIPNGTDQPNNHSQSPKMFGKLFGTSKWDEKTWDKMDRDLDEHAKKTNLKELFDGSFDSKPSSPYPQDPSQRSGGFKSVSVRTYRSADGKVEERRTMKDGVGNEQSVVMRHIDGQTHTVTTERDGEGEANVVDENFRNMDRRELNDFDRRWHSPSPNFDRDRPKDDIILPDGKTQSLFKNLFGINFPGFKS